MKYRNLVQFESVDEIIKIDKLDSEDYRERLVKAFAFSESFEQYIIPRICYELDLDATHETKSLQIVGDYGTGKSHLMSLFSIIAEDENYLKHVSNQNAKNNLQKIAGRYKVIRFEISGKYPLWDMVTYQIDKYLEQWGIDYSIYDDKRPIPYYAKLESMMAAFEEAYPEKGLMIVIDEMLFYLQTRPQGDSLVNDLFALEALCRMSDRTKFRMVFGVYEPIYWEQESCLSNMLCKIADHLCICIQIERSDIQSISKQ